MRRFIGASFVTLLLAGTLALAQDLPPPTCEAQVDTLYSDLLKERLIYEVPSGTWTQHLTALGTQLRVTKDAAQMQAQLVQQRIDDVAIQKEINRQTAQQLGTTLQQVMTLKQALETAQARVKDLEAGQASAPQAHR